MATMRMGSARADLHIHPAGDRYKGGDPAGFPAALAASGLAVAVLSDHDQVELAQRLRLEALEAGLTTAIVVGEEISTSDGHLLGLWLSDLVPPGMSLADSVAAIHDQGGLAVVAHPLLPTTISAGRRLLADLAQGPVRQRPDALEAFNPMAAWLPLEARLVARFARAHGYPTVGGSDGHRPEDIGRGFTVFNGATEDDLRAAILADAVAPAGRPYGPHDVVGGVWAQLHEGALNLLRR